MCPGLESRVPLLAKEGSLAEEDTKALYPAARLEAAPQPYEHLNHFRVYRRAVWMLEDTGAG